METPNISSVLTDSDRFDGRIASRYNIDAQLVGVEKQPVKPAATSQSQKQSQEKRTPRKPLNGKAIALLTLIVAFGSVGVVFARNLADRRLVGLIGIGFGASAISGYVLGRPAKRSSQG